MALPSIVFNVNKNGIPNAKPSNGQVPLVFGMSTAGLAGGNVQSIGSFVDVTSSLATGPLAELCGALINLGVPQVLACRIFSGTFGALVHTGTGPVGQTFTGAPMAPYGIFVSSLVTSGIFIKITLGGALGTATYAVSTDGGNTYGASQTLVATNPLPNTGSTFNCPAGTYVINDTYSAQITQVAGSSSAVVQKNVTQGNAQGAGSIAVGGSPIDAYQVVVQIASPGAIAGTAGQAQAVFSYSLDGGNTWSNRVGIPSTAFPIGENSEVTLTFSNTGGVGATPYFVAQDQYLFNTTAPAYSTTDLTNQFQAALNSNPQFGFVIILGRPATAAAAYTLATTVDTLMSTAQANYQFARVLIETPPDTAANSIDLSLQTAFATPNLPSLRVGVGAGDLNFTTADGLQLQRCVTWAAALQMAVTKPGIDIAAVKLGGLPGVSKILRDESVIAGLDNLGFITARTWKGKTGFFLSSAQIMGAIGTNFQYLALGRVMDEALTSCYATLLNYVNDDLTVNPNGTIDETTARGIDTAVGSAAYTALTCPSGDASNVVSTVNRTNNILASSQLIDTIAITPKAYARQIVVNIGFVVQLSATA